MGLLTGGLFVAWRRQRRRVRQADVAYDQLVDDISSLFCCWHCDWCGYCGPHDFCLDCFEVYQA
jgi:hypothetical protein